MNQPNFTSNAAMCERVNNDRSWLDALIVKVAASFDKEFNDVRYDLSAPDESFYISDMIFVNITANTNDLSVDRNKTVSVVVKRPTSIAKFREVMKADAQFHNEILFYRRYAKGDRDFPRCYYTEEKPPTESVLVLHNIGQQGFKLCQWKYRAPSMYLVAAIREIARFHAKAYIMKERRREQFFDIVRDMWESRYDDQPNNSMKVMIEDTMTRGVEYLRDHGYDKDLCDKLEAQLDNAYQKIILPAIEPEEPLATLCHGDFTLNNIFFKAENNELQTMLIDFALIRYGSPVIDLSTFLCLHYAEETDVDFLNNILTVYHDCLKQYLKENCSEICDKYSYEALHEDYRKKGLFGYAIASFFLSMAMGKCEGSPEDLLHLDKKEWGKAMRVMGGDEISKILASMLLKLKEFGCLDHLA